MTVPIPCPICAGEGEVPIYSATDGTQTEYTTRCCYNKDTSIAIERAGGHSEWLRKHLVGEVLHDIEYFDTSPMAQFAVRHAPEGRTP